jgi:hypothetical protein
MSLSPSKLNPPFALDFEDYTLDGDDASTVSSGYRKGGPKESRLHRVALLASTKEVDHMHSVKLSNLPKTASFEDLRAEFKDFGEIGDIYIPYNLKERAPAKDFAIIRFTEKKAADDVLSVTSDMSKSVKGNQLIASPVGRQSSFFSNNTGRLGIANEVCISNEPEKKPFPEQNLSLASVRARAGYPWGSVRELKYLNPKPTTDIWTMHSIKLTNLPRHIT